MQCWYETSVWFTELPCEGEIVVYAICIDRDLTLGEISCLCKAHYEEKMERDRAWFSPDEAIFIYDHTLNSFYLPLELIIDC